jgi:hypothetical protein
MQPAHIFTEEEKQKDGRTADMLTEKYRQRSG